MSENHEPFVGSIGAPLREAPINSLDAPLKGLRSGFIYFGREHVQTPMIPLEPNRLQTKGRPENTKC